LELFENIYLDLFYTYAMVGTARAAVRMAAVSAAVIRFFVLVMLFPPYIFCPPRFSSLQAPYHSPRRRRQGSLTPLILLSKPQPLR